MSNRVRINPAKRRMTEFTIDEVSAVDKPAQEPALASITKNDGDGAFTKEDHQFVDSIVKRYIDPADGAKPFAEVIDERMKSKRYHEAMEIAGPVIYALECSLSSIAGDANLTSATKETMMRQAVEEFLSVMRQKWPRVESAMMKALSEEDGETDLEKGDNDMKKKADDQPKTGLDAVKAQLAEVQKQLDAIAKTDDDDGKSTKKKADDGEDAVAALTKSFAELTEQVAKLSEESEDNLAKAKMTDEEKEYMDKLTSDDAKAKFKAMSADDRKKAMSKTKKSDDTDEVIKTEEGEIRKSEVGPALFSILKAQAAKAENLEKALEDERNLRKYAQYEKRAQDELQHLPGEVTTKADILKAIDELKDEDVKKSALEMLKAGNAAMTAAFSTVGHRKDLSKKGDGSAAGSGFTKRVTEIASRDKCSRTDAMSKARKEYPDEYKAYQEEIGH